VQVAFDGPEGLVRFEEMQPQVVLCDIGLAGMDGFAVARAIRGKLGLKPLLVAITGYGEEGVRQQAEQAGFDRILIKPVPPDVLLELLTAVPIRDTD
jgi:CheY-like chemotaxis protein